MAGYDFDNTATAGRALDGSEPIGADEPIEPVEQGEPDDGERPRTLRVAWSPTAAPAIRRVIVEDLQRRHVPNPLVDEAQIVASELVANAVRHARPLADGTIKVHWRVKGAVVEVEVSDGGSDTVPRAAPPAVYATTGRGLRIVRSLAHEWGVAEHKSGRTVWASLGGPSRRRTS